MVSYSISHLITQVSYTLKLQVIFAETATLTLQHCRSQFTSQNLLLLNCSVTGAGVLGLFRVSLKLQLHFIVTLVLQRDLRQHPHEHDGDMVNSRHEESTGVEVITPTAW